MAPRGNGAGGGYAAAVVQQIQFERLHPHVDIAGDPRSFWQACWSDGRWLVIVTRYRLADLMAELDRRFSKPGLSR